MPNLTPLFFFIGIAGMAIGGYFVLRGTGIPVSFGPLITFVRTVRQARRFETTGGATAQNTDFPAQRTGSEGVRPPVLPTPSTVSAGSLTPAGTSQSLTGRIQNRIAALNSPPRETSGIRVQDPVLKTGPSDAVKQILKGRDWTEPQEIGPAESHRKQIIIVIAIIAVAVLLALGL